MRQKQRWATCWLVLGSAATLMACAADAEQREQPADDAVEVSSQAQARRPAQTNRYIGDYIAIIPSWLAPSDDSVAWYDAQLLSLQNAGEYRLTRVDGAVERGRWLLYRGKPRATSVAFDPTYRGLFLELRPRSGRARTFTYRTSEHLADAIELVNIETYALHGYEYAGTTMKKLAKGPCRTNSCAAALVCNDIAVRSTPRHACIETEYLTLVAPQSP